MTKHYRTFLTQPKPPEKSNTKPKYDDDGNEIQSKSSKPKKIYRRGKLLDPSAPTDSSEGYRDRAKERQDGSSKDYASTYQMLSNFDGSAEMSQYLGGSEVRYILQHLNKNQTLPLPPFPPLTPSLTHIKNK